MESATAFEVRNGHRNAGVAAFAKSLGISQRVVEIGFGISAVGAEISPQMAAHWLEKFNLCNRRHSDVSSDSIARDIANDRWVCTHQGIAFLHDFSAFIDGQHRLEACVKSQKPFRCLVFFGISESAKPVIDVQRPRSAYDASRILALDLTKSQISAIKSAYCGWRTQHCKMTHQEVFTFAEEHKISVEFCRDRYLRKEPGVNGVVVAPVGGAIIRAFDYFQDDDNREGIAAFCDELISGIPENSAVVVAKRFRDHLINASQRHMSGGSSAVDMFRKAERVIEAYLDGQNLKKIVGCERELFPFENEDVDTVE